MLTKVLIIGFILIFLIFSGYVYMKSIEDKIQEDAIKNGEEAIAAYEQLLKVAPSDAVNKERKERADEKINKIINNGNSIVDNTYKL